MRIYNPVILVVLIALLAGCKNSDKSSTEPIIDPNTTSVIVPIALGNKWIRSGTVYDTSGSILSTFTDSISVSRDTTIENSKWFVLQMQGLEYMVANYEKGLYWLYGANSKGIWYQYPAALKDSFIVFGNTSYVRVLSVDTVIIVPAGTFSCYKYQFDSYAFVGTIGGGRTIWFASPNKGFIKSEYYTSTPTSKNQYLYSTTQLTKLVLK